MRSIFPGDRPRDRVARAIAWGYLILTVAFAFATTAERGRLTAENLASMADRAALHAEVAANHERIARLEAAARLRAAK